MVEELDIIKDKMDKVVIDIALVKQQLLTFEKEVFGYHKEFVTLSLKMDVDRKEYYRDFVTKETFGQWLQTGFKPIEKLFWGVLGAIGAAMALQVLNLVWKK